MKNSEFPWEEHIKIFDEDFESFDEKKAKPVLTKSERRELESLYSSLKRSKERLQKYLKNPPTRRKEIEEEIDAVQNAMVDILSDAKIKRILLGRNMFSLRKIPTYYKVISEKAAIAALKKKKLRQFIQTIEVIDVSKLRRYLNKNKITIPGLKKISDAHSIYIFEQHGESFSLVEVVGPKNFEDERTKNFDETENFEDEENFEETENFEDEEIENSSSSSSNSSSKSENSSSSSESKKSSSSSESLSSSESSSSSSSESSFSSSSSSSSISSSSSSSKDPWDMSVPYGENTEYFKNNFNTNLSPEKESEFQAWLENESGKTKKDISRDLEDYDVKGFWFAGGRSIAGHGSDKWKKPNHPTFSTESKYHNTPDSLHGGIWVGGKWGSNSFTPSTKMLKYWDIDILRDYFKKFEPGVELIFIEAKSEFGEKINAPTFAYQTIYHKNPENFLRCRTDAPKKNWRGHDVDKGLKDELLERLNDLPIEIRSTEEGKSPQRPAFVIFRMPEGKDNFVDQIIDALKNESDIFVKSDIGGGGRPRICVAGKVWKNQDGWQNWWETLPDKIKRAYEKVMETNSDLFYETPYDPTKENNERLSDTWRLITAHWSKWIDSRGENIKFTREQIVENAIKAIKEIKIRVKAKKMKHTFMPEKMKETSRHLYSLVRKELPENLQEVGE